MYDYVFPCGGPEGIPAKIKSITRYQIALLRASLDIKYPKPKPPIEDTDLGPVENPMNPEYIDAVKAWNQGQNDKLNILTLHACVVIDDSIISASLKKLDDQVAETRQFMEAIGLPSVDETPYERDVFSVDNSSLVRFLYLVVAGNEYRNLVQVMAIIAQSLESREVAQAAAAATF